MWLVYKHISPSNKVYIGITSLTPALRWVRGNGYKECPIFYRAIQKYGWDNILHKVVIGGLTEELAKEVEIQLISYYKSIGLSYNITDGGDGTCGLKHTDSYKQRMRSLQLGKPKSRESILKLKETKRLYPYRHTDEAKEKIRLAAKIADHSKAAYAAKLKNSKAVVAKDVSGLILFLFNSKRELARFYGISEWIVSTYTNTGKIVKSANILIELI